MRVLSMKQVCENTSLKRASIYRKINPKVSETYDETFPKPFPLSEPKVNTRGKFKGQLQKWGRLGWLESEIDTWVTERAKKRIP